MTFIETGINEQKKKNKKYIPIAKRRDKPDAIAWVIKNYPEIPDNKVAKLIYPGNSPPKECTVNTSYNSQDVSWHTTNEWSELINFSGNSCNMCIYEEYKQPLIDIINILTDREQSLLYIASRFGLVGEINSPFTIILNCPGLDVNIRNSDDSTAAIGAAWSRDNIENGKSDTLFIILEKLKEKGADLTLSNQRGETVKSIIDMRLFKTRQNGYHDEAKNITMLLNKLLDMP